MAGIERKTELLITARDLTSPGVNSAKRSFDDLTSGVNIATSAIAGLAGTAGFFALAQQALDASISMQRFDTALKSATGSSDAAAAAMGFIRAETTRLGLNLESSADGFTKIAAAAHGTRLEGHGVQQIFSAVAEASTVMGLSSDQANGALLAISQMMSKGKVSAEELRGQLGERLPGAFQMAARAMDVTTAELDKMLADGKIYAEDFLPKLAAEMRKTYAGSLPEAINSTQVSINRLQTSVFDLSAELFDTTASGAFTESVNTMAGGITGLTWVVRDLNEALEEMQPKADKFFDLFGDPLKAGVLNSLTGGVYGLTRALEAYGKARQKATHIGDSGSLLPPGMLEDMMADDARLNKKRSTTTTATSKPSWLDQMNLDTANFMAPGMEEEILRARALGYRAPGMGEDMLTGFDFSGFALGGGARSPLDGMDSMAMTMNLLGLPSPEQVEQGMSFLDETMATQFRLRQSWYDLELQQAQERLTQYEIMAGQRVDLERWVTDMTTGSQQLGAQLQGQILDFVSAKSKKHALASLILTKGIALANTFINTQEAAAAALAPPPLGLGPVAGAPLSAEIQVQGAIRMALIAATGLMQGFAMRSSGGSGGGGSSGSAFTGGGTYNSPVITQPQGTIGQEKQALTIVIHGNVIGEEAWVESNLVPALNAAYSRNVTLEFAR